jgi:hypothetical protein
MDLRQEAARNTRFLLVCNRIQLTVISHSRVVADYIYFKARGTGEPGRFGSIVGDQLVRAVTSALPGSRGYAIQVRLWFYA